MKKTLFTLIFAIPFLGFSQSFNFDNNLHGYVGASGFTATVGVTSATLTGNTPPAANPQLSNTTTAGIDATTNKMLRVVLKNTNASGPEYMRASYPQIANPATSVFKDIVISRGDNAFKIYYIDLTNTNWTGTVNSFKLIFKAAGNTNYNVQGGETIEIDDMQFLAPGSPKLTYDFTNGDAEVFTATGTGASVSSSNGNMIWNMTGTTGQDFLQNFYTADLVNNQFIHIFYTNNSDNTSIRASYKTTAGVYGSDGAQVAITPSGSGEAIIDLSSGANRTNAMNLKFNPRVSGTTQAIGSISIDKIVINNSSSTLATGDISKAKNLLQVLVADNTLHFRNVSVNKATIYSMTGQIAKETKVSNNQTDVSSLKAGIYMVKAVAQDGSETITKFIKK